ncbi:hypothetical protein Y1Q_0024645 [Alligator mississippiensis]|uniref:Uncharacterized protein n=1 Tax=Alligator mississippiensis TaxID=8496 RepID=A0A151NB92_ALLMI|nr:hypothetical protein Y1Q_0024645 [Alligator mississippiensis]
MLKFIIQVVCASANNANEGALHLSETRRTPILRSFFYMWFGAKGLNSHTCIHQSCRTDETRLLMFSLFSPVRMLVA